MKTGRRCEQEHYDALQGHTEEVAEITGGHHPGAWLSLWKEKHYGPLILPAKLRSYWQSVTPKRPLPKGFLSRTVVRDRKTVEVPA